MMITPPRGSKDAEEAKEQNSRSGRRKKQRSKEEREVDVKDITPMWYKEEKEEMFDRFAKIMKSEITAAINGLSVEVETLKSTVSASNEQIRALKTENSQLKKTMVTKDEVCHMIKDAKKSNKQQEKN